MSHVYVPPPLPHHLPHHTLTWSDTAKSLSEDHFFLRSKTLHRDEDMLVNTLTAKVREEEGGEGKEEKRREEKRREEKRREEKRRG